MGESDVTPHSQPHRPAALEEHRKSVEVRVLFLNVPADLILEQIIVNF